MAAMRKEDGKDWRPKKKKKGQSYFEKASKQIESQIMNWLLPESEVQLMQMEDRIMGMPRNNLEIFENLYRYLRVRSGGIALAEVKRKELRPAHALALYGHRDSSGFPVQIANTEEALTFLRKKNWNPSLPKGWHLIQYGSLGLGWIKAVPGRTNNYYPQHWRIRM